MIYESDRNMPMSSVRNSYPWESQLGFQEKACRAIEMDNPELLMSAISEGAEIHHPVRPLLVEDNERIERLTRKILRILESPGKQPRGDAAQDSADESERGVEEIFDTSLEKALGL